MSRITFTCNDMEERFEAAVDGELDSKEKKVYELHLRECTNCRAEHEEAMRIAIELPMLLTQTDEVEARALNAARQAINQISGDREEVAVTATKVKKKRTLFLAAAWLGSIVILWRAIAVASAGGKLAVETVGTNNMLANAAASMSMTPVYFGFFILGMLSLTGAAFFALTRVWNN